MMLSFDRGRPIAIIRGGKYDNKILNLYDPTQKCCSKCRATCRTARNKCCADCKGKICGKDCPSEPDIKQALFDVLSENFLRKMKKKMTMDDFNELKHCLTSNSKPEDEQLDEIYRIAKDELSKKSMKEFSIHDDGVIIPLPNFEQPERSFVAGPTGSGKSYYCSKFLSEYRKVHPKCKIYMISDVDKDEVIDKLGTTRIDIETIVGDPIKPEEMKNSIVVFDDIDSIQDKDVSKAVTSLRDSLLRRGRHEDISVIVTSHLMTNYKDTRIILNEVNSITFFPKSGSSSGIDYLLKKYVGLNKSQIQRIFSLPTRSVTVYKHYPMYVIHDHGIYLL